MRNPFREPGRDCVWSWERESSNHSPTPDGLTIDHRQRSQTAWPKKCHSIVSALLTDQWIYPTGAIDVLTKAANPPPVAGRRAVPGSSQRALEPVQLQTASKSQWFQPCENEAKLSPLGRSEDHSGGGVKFGDYILVERLGRGGMCDVFRAIHQEHKYPCALKLLREDQRNDERTQDLFITEADLSLLLHHPNLVTTYEAGEVDGRYFIAMELIEGGTLGQLLSDKEEHAFSLPYDFALFIVSEILEGLHALHSASGKSGRELGLIHRDITPQNIFLSFDGRVVLGDFGVALIQAYGDAEPSQMIGKIGYLAPEMILGEEVDRRADIFSTGIILYELLTETRLFAGGTDEELMEEIALARVTKPRHVKPTFDRRLEAVIMRALSRKAKDRFSTAEEMLYALESHWSKEIANPFALASLLEKVYKERATEWKRRSQTPTRYPRLK